VINCLFITICCRTHPHGDPLSFGILTLEEAIVRFARGKHNDKHEALFAEDCTAGRYPASERPAGQKVVFTNGCFDLLHPGHIRTLEAARSLGDVLVVGLNSDQGVRQLKGPGRPVLPERERAEILAALECVDAVVIFDELTPQKIIAALLPDVLVKGGDWPGDQIVGREEVESAGGRVVSVAVAPGYSTTAMLRKIRALSAPSVAPSASSGRPRS
jgi:D-beta-D-heptose 7-phosphate kinase/D-beta-D-heptose 1-phosphate adenosyltransferase